MTLSIIVAVSDNGVIGRDNGLPWGRMSADLKRFKSLTMGHHLIMGRKTFDSVGKPLPGRTNVVVTRDPAFHADGVVVVRSIEDAIAAVAGDPEPFIAGGAEIYRLSLARSDRIYLTEVHADLEGDTRFPEIDLSTWREVSREEHAADEKNVFPYSFVVYERR